MTHKNVLVTTQLMSCARLVPDFSALFTRESPKQDHLLCYAHLLSLVLTDTTEVIMESASLFSVLKIMLQFSSESHTNGCTGGRKSVKTGETDGLLQ